MTVTLTYDDTLSRIQVAADGIDTDATYAVVDRGYGGGLWSTLRGGASAAVESGALALAVDDYEFRDGVPVTYRVRGYDDTDVLLDTQTATITPTLDRVWLKFIARPYLNRPVVVTEWSDVERPSRSGTFDIVGRVLPVSITDVHGSRRFTLFLRTSSLALASDLDLALSAGFPIYLHAPTDCGIPTMYAVIGDLVQRRPSRRTKSRVFEIPLTEVAAPGPDVIGSAGSWQILLDNYESWQSVLDEFDTWGDVATLIGSASDIIVEG